MNRYYWVNYEYVSENRVFFIGITTLGELEKCFKSFNLLFLWLPYGWVNVSMPIRDVLEIRLTGSSKYSGPSERDDANTHSVAAGAGLEEK